MRFLRLLTIASIAIAIAAKASGLLAQEPTYPNPNLEPIAQICSAEVHRQFDFWVGDWQVKDGAGAVVGTNVIIRVAGGCGLHEYWRGARGSTGTSINWYDPLSDEWHQVWVGQGSYLDLSGGIEGDEMVLSGERETPQGVIVDRITWSPLEDGRVRQVWESSSDGGQTWQLQFDGMYAKR